LARFFSEVQKTYEATIAFGQATDTYDRTGVPVGEFRGVPPEREGLERVLEGFLGRQLQVPPAYSAKKVGGERLHRLARRGIRVTPEPVPVEIRSIELLGLDGGELRIEVSVSSGTYIRSLAHDLGVTTGLGAHLKELRRTRIGSFSVTDSYGLAELEDNLPAELLLAPAEALRDLETVRVGREAAERLRHGRAPRWEELIPAWEGGVAPTRLRILDLEGQLLAVGEPDAGGGVIKPILVWAAASGAR